MKLKQPSACAAWKRDMYRGGVAVLKRTRRGQSMEEDAMGASEKVELSPVPKNSVKLRLAVIGLAFLGSAAAVWSVLEGQRIQSQQTVLAERETRFSQIGTELIVAKDRLNSQTGALTALQ